MTTNYAALLVGVKKTLKVDEIDERFPEEDEIVVKNGAVAMNKIDIAMQETPWDDFPYPLVLGTDVAGEVVGIGSQVTQFEVGDRVLGHALRLATSDDRHGAFQNYTVLMSNMACKIPSSLSFAEAAVLPLSVSTAAAGLFQESTLALDPPSLNPQRKRIWVIVMGATGSVGSNGVRLAAAAGYEVIATASPRNFDLVKRMGAAEVVDYNNPQLGDALAQALSGKEIAGAFDATGQEDSIRAAAKAVSLCNGRQFVATVGDEVPDGVEAQPIMAIDIRNNSVGKMVYEDYLPHALAAGKYMPYPEPLIFGEGLRSIQKALEKSKDGRATSGKKVVVTID